MGTTTNGFVLTEEKDPFKIWRNIKWTLFEEMKNHSGIDDIRAVWGDLYHMPRCEISDFAEHMRVVFRFAGEERDMSVSLTCDNDYSDFKEGKKVIVSLGWWGHSVHLIETVMKGLSEFGEAYMCDEDMSENWRQIK